MVNYKDPPVEDVLAPVALDDAIKLIQTALAVNLSWLQKAFGRCQVQPAPRTHKPGQGQEKGLQGRDDVIPEVYYKREPYDARPNDNLAAYCFFHARDPQRFEDWLPFDRSAMVAQPLSIIFWANLSKVDPTKDYNFTEELRAQVVQVLKRCPGFRLDEAMSEPHRVFIPFALGDTFKQYMKPPYTAFRFDGIITFDYFKC